MNKRVDKLNLDRMSDMADIQAKMGLVGKSASRHLETLRAQLFRECQTLFELATKPCSIVFDAFREDSYTDGGIIHKIIFCAISRMFFGPGNKNYFFNFYAK